MERGYKMIRGKFLGTASIPTSERNSQGILIDFNGATSILVDCGEGIQRQLLKTKTNLAKINDIFLTHHHIDHIYGIGGVLTLLLNKFPEKNVTVYAPNDVIEIVRGLVNFFIPEKSCRIKYIQMKDKQQIETDAFSFHTFKTYHTESSLGYCFELGNRKIALLGDVSIPNNYAHEQIVKNILRADVAIIDGVHITVEEATKLAKHAQIKQLYLMPILLNSTVEEVLSQASINFPDSHVPNDFEEFRLECIK